MIVKLFDSELKVMEFLWEAGTLHARELAGLAGKQIGWSKTTTYTVIKKCIEKGAIERTEPGFVCRPLISRDEVRQYETEELIDKLYDGSADKLIAALLDGQKLKRDEINRLKAMIEGL